MALIDGNILLNSQYVFNGRGPFDAKMLVKSYADLLAPETWYDTEGNSLAYNGMLVAVWRDTDLSKNGIYFLYNGSRNNKDLDVANEQNWHKLVNVTDLENSLSAIDNRLVSLEEKESDVVTYGYRKDFPTTGEQNKLYVAADLEKTFIWFDGEYLLVGGGSYKEPDIICGGSANAD